MGAARSRGGAGSLGAALDGDDRRSPRRRVAIRLRAVTKTYGRGSGAVHALRGVDLDLRRGELTAVMGPSGSGKSTLLHAAAGLDVPSSGSVLLGDTELVGMSETARTRLRRERIGFVFQSYNLLPALTVAKNVGLPLRLGGRRVDGRRVAAVLGQVGLADRAGHRAGQLSGGQQQRVAIARALVTEPDVVFGDEPTGALDTMTAKQILALLRRLVDVADQTVVMVTHDPFAASHADRVVLLADGEVAGEMASPGADEIAERMTRLGAWA